MGRLVKNATVFPTRQLKRTHDNLPTTAAARGTSGENIEQRERCNEAEVEEKRQPGAGASKSGKNKEISSYNPRLRGDK